MTTTDKTRPAVPLPEIEPDGHVGPPRRRRRVLLWLTVGAVIAAAAGTVYWYVLAGDGTDTAADAETGPVATAEVTRATLTATEAWDGTLGYGSPSTVAAQATGTVTRLVDQGATVERGTTLYRLDERPVTLLYGAIPMYRDVMAGDSGVDVEQIEANLAELGYDGFTADDEYTDDTAATVREWQDDIGADETGVVSRSSVVFLPAGGLVDGLHLDVGDPVSPGADVLDITGAEQMVSLEVDIDDRDLVAVDTELTITLPDGTEVAGTVSSANVVEVESESESGGGLGGGGGEGGETETVTAVEVTLAEAAPEEFISAPVDVIVGVDERADVLTVPVNALLALVEGGYGLEVVDEDGTTSIVPVDTGLFADGRVEITTDAIADGTIVGVAGR